MSKNKLKQLGRYCIETELGRGAMGVVYKALDPVLDRTVALKTIALDDAALEHEEYQTRFFQEAKAAAGLNHPALITIYDFGEQDKLAYMALELLEGEELSTRLERGALEVAEAVAVAEQVAEGLGFAHDHGVIHRDIKPGNIMLLPRGRAKIMDFGVARLKQSDVKTQLGTRLGTPRYMSPEQVAGVAVDHRSDIFSLGIVLYEMLTGGKLFTGDDLTQVMRNVSTFNPPPSSRINPAVPAMLDLVVQRALEKKVDLRYASAWEMVDDLRRCRQELTVAAAMVTAQPDATQVLPPASETENADKTQLIQPGGDSTQFLRRLTTPVNDERRQALSHRFDSSLALARLRTPGARDRRHLARMPRAPGLLRRLRHDRDLASLLHALAWTVIVAALVALS